MPGLGVPSSHAADSELPAGYLGCSISPDLSRQLLKARCHGRLAPAHHSVSADWRLCLVSEDLFEPLYVCL